MVAHAQEQQLDKVEITGSAIKRIDAETAVPVTIMKVEEIKKQGITTVEQLISQLSGSQTSTGTSQSVGLSTGGAAFADLRGVGQNKTLVLLNGRRIANNAIDGSAPDLNMIPFAALQRVEVLRDGASALYGTDAIGGVINFITRKDYKGGTVTIGADQPEHTGGQSYNANFGYGFGDLDQDRYNVFGFFDYQKQLPLSASQRSYNDRIIKTSGSPDPANYYQGGDSANPAYPSCNSPFGVPTGAESCGYLYSRWVDLIPKTERLSGMLKGTLQVATEHQLNVEYFITQNTNSTVIAPVPYGALVMNPSSPFYPGAGSTPAPSTITLDPNYWDASYNPTGAVPGYINVKWRDVPNGGRQEQTKNTQQRFLTSLEGKIAGWDYNAGIAYNENKITDKLTGGYSDGDIIYNGVLDGIINPFGAQTAAGTALLQSAGVTGTLFTAKGQVTTVDAHASRELSDWFNAGRPAALAVGTEFSHQEFYQKANVAFAEKVVASTGYDPATDNEGKRDVFAFYSELNVPVLKQLEFTGSVRYDKYSDFGDTVNPKVSFRFQPVEKFLIRGSYSTGFRAPSLYELNSPQTYTNTANNWNDPVRCPGGTAIPGASTAANCDTQFLTLTGGNKDLKPEKSKNWTLGFVVEPINNLSLGFDFWWLKLEHSIGVLADTTIFSDPTKFAALFVRAPDGSLSTDGSQCPGANCGYILDLTENLGGVNSNGIDLSANYRWRAGDIGTFNFGFNGTYVNKYEYQDEEGGAWIQNVGIYSGTGPIFRWQHNLTAAWNRGDWSAGLVNRYKSGYTDANGVNKVPAYSLWDAYGTWQATKALTLTAGIRNLLDKDPPLSTQTATFQVGYDPRYTDPLGRVYYVRGTYSF